MVIQIYWSLKAIEVCCEENIFTLILSKGIIILHVHVCIHITHFTIRK